MNTPTSTMTGLPTSISFERPPHVLQRPETQPGIVVAVGCDPIHRLGSSKRTHRARTQSRCCVVASLSLIGTLDVLRGFDHFAAACRQRKLRWLYMSSARCDNRESD